MTGKRDAGRFRRVVVLLATLALGVAGISAAPGAPLVALRPLDERHAAEFRRAFDDAKDRARYVVALSPT